MPLKSPGIYSASAAGQRERTAIAEAAIAFLEARLGVSIDRGDPMVGALVQQGLALMEPHDRYSLLGFDRPSLPNPSRKIAVTYDVPRTCVTCAHKKNRRTGVTTGREWCELSMECFPSVCELFQR
jgi:hypothetical protein